MLLSKLAVIDCLHDGIRIDKVQFAAVRDQEGCITDLIDDTWSPVRCIKNSFERVFLEDRLCTARPPELSVDIRGTFFLSKAVKVVVHDDPLAEGLMDTETECVVEDREACEKDDGPVTGIHVEVEEDLQVVQDRRIDIVRLVNDDDGRLPFLDGKPVDLSLYDAEIVRFPVGRDAAELGYKVPVEIIQGQGGQAAVDDLIKGRVHLMGPVPYHGRFPEARPSCQDAESLHLQEVIQAYACFPVLFRLDQYLA